MWLKISCASVCCNEVSFYCIYHEFVRERERESYVCILMVLCLEMCCSWEAKFYIMSSALRTLLVPGHMPTLHLQFFSIADTAHAVWVLWFLFNYSF